MLFCEEEVWIDSCGTGAVERLLKEVDGNELGPELSPGSVLWLLKFVDAERWGSTLLTRDASSSSSVKSIGADIAGNSDRSAEKGDLCKQYSK